MDRIPELSMSPMFAIASLLASAIILIFRHWLKSNAKTIQGQKSSVQTSQSDSTPDLACYTSVTATPDFKWEDERPIQFRPFKPKYHLTMALETIKIDDLVPVDNTYRERINIRREILQQHPSTHGSRPGSDAVVYEFYDWMMRTYLPQRYPSMYSFSSGEKPCLRNLVTNEDIPLQATSIEQALTTLGAHVDNDFLFLIKSPDDDKYHLEAFVACFPSGFSTLEKMGMPLAAIHTPVPGYAARLEKSMDRFFASIPVGKVVKRANWSITTNDLLFAETGNHLYSDGSTHSGNDHEDAHAAKPADLEGEIERQKAEVDVAACRLRCERQTLHRLPGTQALVFGFKTYQYKLADVKAEGSGAELAAAIDGLGEGNVPEMKFYKRGVIWGDKVKEFLLS